MMKMLEAPLAYGAMAAYPCTDAIKAKYTTTSRFGDVLHLYEVSADGKTIFLPRMTCPKGPNDQRVNGHPVKLGSKFVARSEEQQRVVDESLELLRNDESHIIQAGTGFGKTVVASKIIDEIGVFTLIVCTKDDLVKQWIKRLIQFTDLKASDIGLIQQDKCQVYGKKVVVASIKSLTIPGRYPPAIRTLFGMVVFDECHRLGADTFSRAAAMFPSKLRLGLSATPKRVDGKEVVFNAHIGRVRVKAAQVPMKPKVMRYKTGWTCPRQKTADGFKRIPHSPGRAGHVVNMLFKDPVRNQLITYLSLKTFERGRRLVIFSSTIEHLEFLERMLVASGVPRSKIGHYYGAMSGPALDHALGCEIILATPGKMGEGTDAPWIDTCILAAPLANIEQIVGRILREYPDKKKPIVFDLVDDDSPVFKGYVRTRDEFYTRIGAEVVEMEMYSGAQ